jgi:putative PIN family toxin of toxin-antitoxin system
MQDIPRVVLDTNILVSGVLFPGKPRAVLDLAIEGKIEAVSSRELLEEFQGVLGRPKFRLQTVEVHAIADELESILTVVFPERRVSAIKDDPDDNAVLECALEARAAMIVTGDSHLLGIEGFEGMRILTADEFLREMAK